MASMLIRNLDDDVKGRLKLRAKRHGRSLEAEVRSLLQDAAKKEDAPVKGLGTQLVELFEEFGITELQLPLRQISEPIDLDK